MKSEEEIRNNLNAKLGILLSEQNTSNKLKEHIRMLDWVLNDGFVRNIEEIINEAKDKIENSDWDGEE